VFVNLLGLVGTALAVVACFAAWTYGRRLNVAMRVLLLGVFGILSVPSILFAGYYLHVLPETEWFYELRAARGSEFLAVFAGAAGGFFASLLPRLLLALPLAGVIGLTLLPYAKPMISPLDPSIVQDRWKDGACLQSTTSTCGPASLCTILRHLDVEGTEAEVARAAHSYSGGTEAWYLARVAREKGLSAEFDFTNGDIDSAELPAIAGVRIGGYGHFIVLLGVEGEVVTFVDPLEGKRSVPVGEFRKRYLLTPFRLVVRKS
jgi:hypothetical protein